MSDSAFIVSDFLDPAWDGDTLEPDDLEVPNELENAELGLADNGTLRDDENTGERIMGATEGSWNDLGLDVFVQEASEELRDDREGEPNTTTDT